MQLVGIAIGRYRHLQEVELALGSMTLLFGKNGAGKSTIIQAIREGWPGSRMAADAAHYGGTEVPIRVALRLDSSADGRVLASVRSAGATDVRDTWAELRRTIFDSTPDISDKLARQIEEPFARIVDLCPDDESWDASIQELNEKLLVGHVDDHAARRAVEALTAAPILLVGPAVIEPNKHQAQTLGASAAMIETHLAADVRELPEQVRRDWTEIAGDEAFDGSPLGDAARAIASADTEIVSILTLGPVPSERWTPPVPLLTLETDPTALAEDVEEWLPDIFGRLIGISRLGDPWLSFERNDDSDPWLEEAVEGEPEEGYRLRTGLRAAVSAVESEANRIAPNFLVEEGARVQISVVEPPLWPREGRLNIRYVRHGRELALGDVGEGSRRWIAVTIREACRTLAAAHRETVVLPDGTLYRDTPAALDAALEREEAYPLELESIEYSLPPSPGLLIVDEPELHLHPTAVADVRRWLEQRANSGLQVIAATHAPQLLDVDSELAEHLYVTATPGGTAVARVGHKLIEYLEQAAVDNGLNIGDVLQLVRVLAVVEGKHDVEVIEHFYAEELRRSRALLLRLEGTGNSLALVDSDYLTRQQLPLRVMFDNVGASPLKRGRQLDSSEERAARRLGELADERGLDVTFIPFEPPDIICALPEPAVRRAYPQAAFTGWDPIVNKWRSLGASTHRPAGGFKQWVLTEIGLPKVRPTTFLRDVLLACETHERPSPHLERAVRELLASTHDVSGQCGNGSS